MVLINFFYPKKTTPATIAKKRLQIIISERKFKMKNFIEPLFFSQLRNDLLQIMKKYTHDPKILSFQLQQEDENIYSLICQICFINNNK